MGGGILATYLKSVMRCRINIERREFQVQVVRHQVPFYIPALHHDAQDDR
eukprot:SAG11_NODE_110_length_16199_cov_18.081180_14_plen_50_part_00